MPKHTTRKAIRDLQQRCEAGNRYAAGIHNGNYNPNPPGTRKRKQAKKPSRRRF